MAVERKWYADLVPFTAMVMVECINVGLNTLYKAASDQGLSNYVFLVYCYGVAAIAMLPAPFFSSRSTVLPLLTLSIIWKICLLGVVGCTSQSMVYAGITYSSPTLASAISNLVPAFTFIFAVMFGMEIVKIERWSSRAKVIGTIVSVAGAFVVTLYKGPRLYPIPNTLTQILDAPKPDWVLGGVLLTISYVLSPMWYIIQKKIVTEYPAELTVVFFYNICVSIPAAIVGIYRVPHLSAWMIKPDISLLSILCSGFFGSFINNAIHTWVLRVKGPVFVTMFKPLSMAIAVVMGFVFLGDTLYLGSVVGATIISIGFYTVKWGKVKEETVKNNEISNMESSKAPLLQNSTDPEKPV